MLESTMSRLVGAIGRGEKEQTESEFDKDGDKPAACEPKTGSPSGARTYHLYSVPLCSCPRFSVPRAPAD